MTSFSRRCTTGLLLALSALSISTAALGQPNPSQYYEDALRYVADGADEEALLQLRNALQLDDQHLPSLLLLGDLMIRTGSPIIAYEAYAEALILGADPNYVVPRLADILLMQGELQQLLEEYPANAVSGSAQGELLGIRSMAHRELGQSSAAEAALDEAIRTFPAARAVQIALAERALTNGNPDKALSITLPLLDRYPGDVRVWSAHGSNLSALGRDDEALEFYERALGIDETFAPALLAKTALLTSANRLDEAERAAEQLLATNPRDPRGAFLRAQLFELEGDRDAASELYRATMDLMSELSPQQLAADLQLTVVYATASVRSGARERAIEVLTSYQSEHEDEEVTGRFLAQTLLQAGDGLGAMSVLEPLIFENPESLELMSLQAGALATQGLHEDAVRQWKKVKSLDVENNSIALEIARSQIAIEDFEEAIENLQNAASQNPDGTAERELLVIAALAIGNNSLALNEAHKLHVQDPLNSSFHAQYALTLLRSGDVANAERELLELRERYPDSGDVAAALIEVKLRKGEIEGAKADLEALNEIYPENFALALQRAQVERALGNLQEAQKFVERAASLSPEAIGARSEMVDLLVAQGDIEGAIAASSLGSRGVSDDIKSHLLRAETLAKTGKMAEAAIEYKLASRLEGIRHRDLYRVASAQAGLGQFGDASASLYLALRQSPDSIKYQGALIDVTIRLDNLAQAERMSAALLSEHPEDATVLWLRGNTLLANGKIKEAERAYKASLQLNPEYRAAMLGHFRALVSQKNSEAGKKVLENWLSAHGNDAEVALMLSGLLFAEDEYDEALGILEKTVDSTPENAALLNNVAYLRHLLGKASALEAAHAAHAISPTAPEINDTLGVILLSQQQAEEALPYLRQAVSRGGTPSRRYHLAQALNELGRHEEAKVELRQALSAQVFPDRRKAELLLNAIP